MTTARIYFIFLCLGLALAASAGPAFANVAANTRITNQATLSYNDGTGTKTSTTSVTVTVALVPTAPTIIPGPPQTTSYNGPGTTLTNSFIVIANANGPDSYNLSATVPASANTTGPAATPTSPSVSLGASVSLAGSTQNSIIVPADGTDDSSVNGIQAGDTVVINNEGRQVANITDNLSGTSTIVLVSPLTNPAPGAGVLVAEQKTVTVSVTAGTITTAGTNITVSNSLTATSSTLGSATTTSGSILDTYTSGVASLTTYVRNLTTASGTGVPYIYNSTNYYQNGVTGKPGDTLEYILVANNSGNGAVTAAAITDVLPTDFATLKANAYAAGKEVIYVNDAGVTSMLSATGDTDAATYDGGTRTLTVNVGTGATNAAGGSMPGGNKNILVLYQLTINP